MRASKKADRAMEQLAKMLASHGIEDKVIEDVRESAPTHRDAISRQGEAVLLFLESPAKFTTKYCKRPVCGEPFGTNYRGVAYCSDNCRSKHMSDLIGVKWDWLRATDEERWGGEPPLIIPPAAYRKIRQFVTFFVDSLQTQSQTESPQQISKHQDHQDAVHHLVASFEASDQDYRRGLDLLEEDTARTNPQQSPPELTASPILEAEDPFDFE